MSSPLHLVVASDSRYLPGAIGTLAGVRLAVPRETSIYVRFLHEGLSRSDQHRLTAAMEKLENGPQVEFVPVDADFGLFPDGDLSSAMAYARLVLPEKVDAERVVYLDTDMLVLRDLSELTRSGPPGAKGVGGVLERSGPTLEHDFPEIPGSHDPGWSYLSCGLLVLDMPTVRQAGVFERAMEILKTHPEACRNHDRSALNYALEGEAYLFDAGWNLQTHREHYDPVAAIPELAARAVNVHFVGRGKPWLSFVPFPAEQMFRMLLDALEPRWKEDRHTKMIRAKSPEPYASAMPWLHGFRSVFRKLRGKDSEEERKAAMVWKQFNRDVERLEAQDAEAMKLYEDWQAQIDAGLVKRSGRVR
ncbi:MAG: glycosyltransferase [Luteolibacter sp.]